MIRSKVLNAIVGLTFAVGVTAGASTPKWLIDEVVERLESIGKNMALQ